MTSAKYANVFERVCKDILGVKDGSPVMLAFEQQGIYGMPDLLSFPTEDVDKLEYIPAATSATKATKIATPLGLGQKSLIKWFLRWHRVLLAKNGNVVLSEADWMNASSDDFNNYRIADNGTPFNVGGTHGNNNTGAAATPRPSTSAVSDFKKGIKRDASLYPTLKEQKHWNNWNRAVIAQARAHDVSEVFDTAYVPDPNDPDQVALFKEKQSFVYSVLNKCVVTDHGKAYIREHEDDFDAQAVYCKLVQYASTSTAAELAKDSLIEFLTTSKLNSSWRGTTEGYILHWREQFRLLDDLLPASQRYDPYVKKRMLESAVKQVPELQRIKDIDNNRIAAGGTSMDYDKYCEVLMSAAVQRDDQLKIPASRSHRVVQNADSSWNRNDRQEDFYDQGYLDAGDAHLDSASDQNLSVNRAYQQSAPNNNNRTSTRLPREIWNKLPEEAKLIIRGIDPTKATERKVNRHDFVDIGYYDDPDNTKIDNEDEDYATYDASKSGDDSCKDGENTTDQANDSAAILAHITKRKPLPSNIKSVLASAHDRRKSGMNAPINDPKRLSVANTTSKESITVDGRRYVLADVHRVNYRVAESSAVVSKVSSLVDRGANGGLAGQDVRVIETTTRFADVSGINDHTIEGLPIATVAGVVSTHLGPVCLIMHQYAYHGKGKTIHSCVQVEHHGNDVNDKSAKVKGGKQCITTLDGYVIPLQIRGGLAYLDMHPPSDEEYDALPHVVFTADTDWNPTIVDNEVDLEEWLDARIEDDDIPGFNEYGDQKFDDQGFYRQVNASQLYSQNYFFDAEESTVDNAVASIEHQYRVNNQEVTAKNPNFETLRPFFAWATVDAIKRTFDCTTRWARSVEHRPFRKHFKSRFPALNVHRRREPVATDTVYSDTPAIDSGVTSAQIFVGTQSMVTDVYGMKSDKDFVNTLEDNIRKRGAMDKLVSDRAQLEISNKVLDILRNYVIDDWQSEPYHEHQNAAERRYQVVKETTNKVMDRTGAPAYTWLLALLYVCYVLNHTASETLGWQTPLYYLTGITTDISALLQFQFWEPVYFATGDALKYDGKTPFPSGIAEAKGRFVGFAESVGDVLTYKVLSDDTKKIIYRSYVRSAVTESERNLRLDSASGETTTSKPIEIVKARSNPEVEGEDRTSMVVFEPDDLINKTYLTEPDDEGQRFRAKIVQKIVDNNNAIEQNPDRVKFLIQVEGDKADEIVAYRDILNYLEEQMTDTSENVWNFKDIIGHEGPLSPGDPSYKGSSYNVMIAWEDGSRTFEPLSLIVADCPVICAMYGKRMGLLDQPGWRRLKTIAKREKKMVRMANQAKLASFRRGPLYNFGVLVPRSPAEAIKIDAENSNTLWQDAMALEMSQLQEYDTFKDLGRGAAPPIGHRKIRVHFVFAVKHDGRHKARLVADGHLTETPIDSVYSGVVSLRSLRIVVFLAELNNLELYAADVSNAYLEATTKEKVYIIGGTGFGELEGHTMVIHKALYGLKSSGRRWHERLYDVMRNMGFNPSKADSDVWMRKVGDAYEYVAVYVDDLAIASKEPKLITDALIKDYKLKLKGVGPIEYHLGCDFYRDPDGTLCVGPKRYVEKMIGAYERMFGEMPYPYSSPLEKNDHPELDDTQELGEEDITKYQSMIGALQWAISLGRFDILTPVMTMSSYRVAPRQGHLARLKRIYGYLRKFKHGAVRYRTGLPDYSKLVEVEYDWMYSVYGNVKEQVPHDIPEALGNEVVTTTYVDANLYHDMITGRSVTGVLHLMNGTPIDWFSKRQDTVETATYGSEFVAARIATEQIIDMRTTLRYLGVPIQGKSYMFGDNQSVITSSTIPHSRLSKRHNALSYHRVREAIVAGIIKFFHIDGKENPADILSKHCGYPQLWPHVQPLLFWLGSTNVAENGGEKRCNNKGGDKAEL